MLSVAATASIAIEHGFYETPLSWQALRSALLLLMAAHIFASVRSALPARGRGRWAPEMALGAALAIGALLTVLGEPLAWRLAEAAVIVRLGADLWELNVVLSHRLPRPEALFPLSFIVLIAAGAMLLKLPKAVPHGQSIGWIDALFTSTSATCVTGLAVRSTASEFSIVGQMIICGLIQLGGFGIILFGSTLMMLMGRSLSLRQNQSLRQMLADQPVHRLLSYGRFVLLTTLVVELIGAAAMYSLWLPGDVGSEGRLWLSVFHSVSAFCNAGFDITGESMVPYRYAPLAHGVVVPLIVLGGIGFPVLDNVLRVLRVRWRRWRSRGRAPLPPGFRVADARLTLHSRLAIWTTACLYLGGFVVIFLAQALTSWGTPVPLETSPAERLLAVASDASFMAVTARTAGFNSMPMEELAPGSVFALMTLMVIGGSPGSTAGGMKTTTLAVLVLSIVATVRQRKEAEAFGRSISDATIRKAGTLGLCYVGLIAGTTLALALVEPFELEPVLFEAISASTTTGLSLGITGDLSPAGKMVLIAAMFLGRVGPLALLTVLIFGRGVDRPYTYAHEDVAMG